MTTRLKVGGVAGLVSDGAVRDSEAIAALDFPVFCAGASAPLNLVKHHNVDMNLPMGCGGVAVFPGDVIAGDMDGVVVIPRALADEVALNAAAQEQLEGFIISRIEQGAPLLDTYLPNAATMADFREWQQSRRSTRDLAVTSSQPLTAQSSSTLPQKRTE